VITEQISLGNIRGASRYSSTVTVGIEIPQAHDAHLCAWVTEGSPADE
jgi:hypothetical protein